MSSRVKLRSEGVSVQVSGTVEKNRNEILSKKKGGWKDRTHPKKRAAQGKFNNASLH